MHTQLKYAPRYTLLRDESLGVSRAVHQRTGAANRQPAAITHASAAITITHASATCFAYRAPGATIIRYAIRLRGWRSAPTRLLAGSRGDVRASSKRAGSTAEKRRANDISNTLVGRYRLAPPHL
jgi:hypothetical protein